MGGRDAIEARTGWRVDQCAHATLCSICFRGALDSSELNMSESSVSCHEAQFSVQVSSLLHDPVSVDPSQLYVYDLSNGLAKSLSRQLTGRQFDAIYHTSIVVYGVEWFFGQGIASSQPGQTHVSVSHLGRK